MKLNTLLLLVPLAAFTAAQAPTSMALKFTKGETIKYRSTVSGAESVSFKGDTSAIRMSGTDVITIKVTSASPAKAAMSVTYGSATASATATSLPKEARSKKSEIEKQYAQALKKSLAGGSRTQTVTSRGVTTFRIQVGDGKSLTIEDGAFMMLVLPSKAPAVNSTWKATVRMPSPASTESLKMTYKLVGMKDVGGEPAYKIAFSAGDSQSKKQGDLSAKATFKLNGYCLLGSKSGKLLYGEVSRSTTTVLSGKEGTRTAVQNSLQTYTKA